MKRYADLRKKEDGFTLIELLIVIVILGVLAGVVVFAVSGINNKGEVAACKAEAKTIEVASEAYYAQKGTYAAAVFGAAPINSLEAAGLLHADTLDPKITYTAGVVTNTCG